MKIFWTALFFLLLLPASAAAYSYQTEDYRSFRTFVFELEENRFDQATDEEKAALRLELNAKSALAASSIVAVRDGEIARLNAQYQKFVARENAKAAASTSSANRYWSKWCTRKKRGKTVKQKESIDRICQQKKSFAQSKIKARKDKELALIEKRFGRTSRSQERVQSGYEEAEAKRVSYIARGEAAINLMPPPPPPEEQ